MVMLVSDIVKVHKTRDKTIDEIFNMNIMAQGGSAYVYSELDVETFPKNANKDVVESCNLWRCCTQGHLYYTMLTKSGHV